VGWNDVTACKATLDVYRSDTEAFSRIPNEITPIGAFVASMPAGMLVAFEPTNMFHDIMVRPKVLAGFGAYINGAQKADGREPGVTPTGRHCDRMSSQPASVSRKREVFACRLLDPSRSRMNTWTRG